MACPAPAAPAPRVAARVAACVCVVLLASRSAAAPAGVGVDPTRWFTQAQIERAGGYHSKLLMLGAITFAAKAALLMLLYRYRGAVRRLLGAGVQRRWYTEVAAWALIASVAAAGVNVAAGALAHHWDVAEGLTRQTFGSWLGDIAKVRLRGVTVSVLAIVGVYACIGLLGRRRWWAGAFVLIMLVRVVPPLFMGHRTSTLRYEFVPLEQGPLRTHIESLTTKSNHQVARIKIARTSRIGSRANAWIGLFGTERHLVLTDTMVERYTPAEIGVVVAHELGHLREHTFVRHVITAAIGTLVRLAVAHLLLVRAATGPSKRFGPPESVPLYLVAVLAAAVLCGPLHNQIRQRRERAADLYAIDLTGDPDAFISVRQRVAIENLSPIHPPWLVRTLLAGHPSAAEAIAEAYKWRAKRRL